MSFEPRKIVHGLVLELLALALVQHFPHLGFGREGVLSLCVLAVRDFPWKFENLEIESHFFVDRKSFLRPFLGVNFGHFE